MTTPYDDPYHDEDATDIDIGKPVEGAPLLRTFKHVGDTIMGGGFCSPRKGDKGKQDKSEEKDSKERHDEVKTPDTTMDATSLSDESDNEALDKKDSVSFPEEPLIVSDLEVPDDEVVEPETESAVMEEKSESKSRSLISAESPAETSILTTASTSTTTKQEETAEKKFSSKSVPTTFIVLVTIGAALFQFFNEEFLSPAMLKLFSPLQAHSIMLQIRVEDATGVEMHQIVTGVVGSMLFLVAMKGIFASEKRLKALIEFVW
eukprot:CAMPEP_0203672192 /NCGR_PEP_ID=MMETSP0090-20130426/7762_1 /ASSEMBLY_ACC=CAM_ASM_001088 /TAXON_ID=426623 /ORGANISM="Chaetoceros affinis, Strain CCMP159" /LENGTH=261 /DNA_ID=CAMNT_0050537455 /DNA_START=253 /DNA_END=1035 /DNA_ORIENTATION=+